MNELTLIEFPDPRLREISDPVETVDRDIRALMDKMGEKVYSEDAAGFAAIQMGIKKRIVVIDRNLGQKTTDALLFMANPEIEWVSEEKQRHAEGCFSVPGFYEEVTRPAALRVSYLDENNLSQILEATGILAHCIHHEVDHLNGVLLIDHLSALKRQLITHKLRKRARQRR